MRVAVLIASTYAVISSSVSGCNFPIRSYVDRPDKCLVTKQNFFGAPRICATAVAASSKVQEEPEQEKQTFKDHMLRLLSGAAAGSIASTITCPIEVIKTQLQSSTSLSKSGVLGVAKSIYVADGILGFWRGLSLSLVGIIPNRATYFWSYETTKSALTPMFGAANPINHLFSAVAAGMSANTITNPIWMVKTRMQILADTSMGHKVYSGIGDAIRTIFKEEGYRGFFKGLSASYWGCSEGAIQFIVYEELMKRQRGTLEASRKQALSGAHVTTEGNPAFEENEGEGEAKAAAAVVDTHNLHWSRYLLSAAAAKFIATTLTYPHEVVRTRMREQASNGVFRYHGMWQSIGLIAREEGKRGLYSGMGVHICKVVPNTALMFMSYELIGAFLKKKKQEEKEALKAKEREEAEALALMPAAPTPSPSPAAAAATAFAVPPAAGKEAANFLPIRRIDFFSGVRN